jgi:hypothetical protein
MLGLQKISRKAGFAYYNDNLRVEGEMLQLL